MKFAVTAFAPAAIALALSASPGTAAADTKTWYVYCEGAAQGDHWAVFSENFWPHPVTEGYGRMVGRAAKDFFEARHDVRLEGCAAVNFIDSSLAEHSRSRTAQLHRQMGDRVLYFPLPPEALPGATVAPVAPVSARAIGPAPESAPPAGPDAGRTTEPQRPDR